MITCGVQQQLSRFAAKTDNQLFKFGARSASTSARPLLELAEANST